MDFEYTIENGVVTIKKYIGTNRDVIIPNTIENYPVPLLVPVNRKKVI